MKPGLNVFFAVSKAYVQYFTVALTSLLENNKDLNFEVYVLIDQSDRAFFEVTEQFVKDKYGLGLNFINTGNIDFSKFRITDNFPKYTYFRLFLADLAPKDMEVALFLDADIVVAKSIRDLAEINMDKKYIAAVSETSVADNVARLNKLGFSSNGYFNAGVLLVNIMAWREEKLSDKFFQIAAKYPHLEWVDQDILNMYFSDNWLKLDRKFNAIHLNEKMAEEPVIIHYNTFSKPWLYVDTHPYNYLYQRYHQLTPFKYYKRTGFSIKNFVLKNGRLIKRKLRENGILKFY